MVRFFLLEEYAAMNGVGRVNGMGGHHHGGGSNGVGTNGTSSSSTGSSPRTHGGYGSNASTPHSTYNSNSSGNYSTMSPNQITPSSAALFNAATSSRKDCTEKSKLPFWWFKKWKFFCIPWYFNFVFFHSSIKKLSMVQTYVKPANGDQKHIINPFFIYHKLLLSSSWRNGHIISSLVKLYKYLFDLYYENFRYV